MSALVFSIIFIIVDEIKDVVITVPMIALYVSVVKIPCWRPKTAETSPKVSLKLKIAPASFDHLFHSGASLGRIRLAERYFAVNAIKMKAAVKMTT